MNELKVTLLDKDELVIAVLKKETSDPVRDFTKYQFAECIIYEFGERRTMSIYRNQLKPESVVPDDPREIVVANNLISSIVPMFYGGHHPTFEEIVRIVNSFTMTEEWRLTEEYETYVVRRIKRKLSK